MMNAPYNRFRLGALFLILVTSLAMPGSARSADNDQPPGASIDTALARADVFLSEGRYRTVIAELAEALANAEALGDARRLAAVTGQLGVAHMAVGEHQVAESYVNRSIDQAKAVSDGRLRALSLSTLGTLQSKQDRLDDALETYEQGINVASAAKQLGVAVDATINRAKLLVELERDEEASDDLDEAYYLLGEVAPSPQKAMQLLSLGRERQRLGQAEQAYYALAAAKSMAEEISDTRLISYGAGYLGELYQEANRHEEALQLFRQAMFQAQKADAPELLYQWQWRVGRLLTTQGDIDGAIETYSNTIRSLAAIRPDLIAAANAGQTSTLVEQVEPVYRELADLLLQQSAAMPDPETKQAYLRRARNVIEGYRAAELEDYFRDDCVAELQSQVQGIDQLDDRAAAIYPIIMEERTVLLLSLPEGLRQVSVPISADKLNEEIIEFRTFLEKRTTRQYLPVAQALYDHLIDPIEDHLERANIDTLVVVPDGLLRTIPLAALHNGDQFLIDRYAVATVPGLGLVAPKAVDQAQLFPLLSGLTEGVQGFPALPHVDDELEAIEMLYGGEVLRDTDFQADQVEAALASAPFSVVHIASHGEFSGESDDSFLLTYDSQISMDRLEEIIKISRFRDEPIELLTLSACETAVGDERAALGLAGLAVKSGARSALATLWYINDQASSILVSAFYKELAQANYGSKAKALRAAQTAIKSDVRYEHPSYWAAFLMIGNWL